MTDEHTENCENNSEKVENQTENNEKKACCGGESGGGSSCPCNPFARFWYLILIAVICVGAFLYWWRFSAFTDQGYVVSQPIPYSHKLHAGTYKMPCTYCHFNAERGKHAGVPPLSVCMGCHDPAQGGVGQDKEGVKTLLELTLNSDGSYKQGAGADYHDTSADDPEAAVLKSGGQVHWNRVHLLPDHVYFRHEWHVKAGVACQECHGPVEEMDVVYQQEDLTMGWCIRCHRDNQYVSYNSGRSGLHDEYDPEDAESFAVGTANYDVIRARIRPDNVVEFNERETAAITGGDEDHDGHGHEDHGHEGHDHAAHAGGHDDDHADNHEDKQRLRGRFDESKLNESGVAPGWSSYWTDAQRDQLKALLAKYPDMPRWRVADLPESHQAFYGQAEGLHQNAPTHCSTCHQ